MQGPKTSQDAASGIRAGLGRPDLTCVPQHQGPRTGLLVCCDCSGFKKEGVFSVLHSVLHCFLNVYLGNTLKHYTLIPLNF